MRDYGYLTPDSDLVPSDMRCLEQLIPYYLTESGKVQVVWPLGCFEGREQMEESARKYIWRLQQNANDMKATAFQLIGAISDEHTRRLRDALTEIDTLVAEIRQN